MNTSIITRKQLEIINRKKFRYPLQTAEKDYFLALVMQIISQSPVGNMLVFKGGTALHHCYLEHSRFSEDLDFSSNQVKLSLEEIRGMFTPFKFLTVKKDYQSEATIKIERLQYTGPLTLPNSLKVEIDRLQKVLLPPKLIKYNNIWGLDFKCRVMDVREICAEKIRAMSDRARYRDFYDFFLLLEMLHINLDEVISYVGRKEIRKPITKVNIYSNWRVVETQKAAEMRQAHYSQPVDDVQIENAIEKLPFVEIPPRNIG